MTDRLMTYAGGNLKTRRRKVREIFMSDKDTVIIVSGILTFAPFK
jgi:hypothetical protein